MCVMKYILLGTFSFKIISSYTTLMIIQYYPHFFALRAYGSPVMALNMFDAFFRRFPSSFALDKLRPTMQVEPETILFASS